MHDASYVTPTLERHQGMASTPQPRLAHPAPSPLAPSASDHRPQRAFSKTMRSSYGNHCDSGYYEAFSHDERLTYWREREERFEERRILAASKASVFKKKLQAAEQSLATAEGDEDYVLEYLDRLDERLSHSIYGYHDPVIRFEPMPSRLRLLQQDAGIRDLVHQANLIENDIASVHWQLKIRLPAEVKHVPKELRALHKQSVRQGERLLERHESRVADAERSLDVLTTLHNEAVQKAERNASLAAESRARIHELITVPPPRASDRARHSDSASASATPTSVATPRGPPPDSSLSSTRKGGVLVFTAVRGTLHIGTVTPPPVALTPLSGSDCEDDSEGSDCGDEDLSVDDRHASRSVSPEHSESYDCATITIHVGGRDVERDCGPDVDIPAYVPPHPGFEDDVYAAWLTGNFRSKDYDAVRDQLVAHYYTVRDVEIECNGGEQRPEDEHPEDDNTAAEQPSDSPQRNDSDDDTADVDYLVGDPPPFWDPSQAICGVAHWHCDDEDTPDSESESSTSDSDLDDNDGTYLLSAIDYCVYYSDSDNTASESSSSAGVDSADDEDTDDDDFFLDHSDSEPEPEPPPSDDDELSS